jgi:recombinational DNA repair ATPase RecF
LSNNVQTFVSSITMPGWIKQEENNIAVFHVEHGKIKKMLK